MRTGYDPFIVHAVVTGAPPPDDLSVAERREIGHRLRQHGHKPTDIAARLRVERQIVEQDANRYEPHVADLAATHRVRHYPAERFDGEAIANAAARFIGRVHDEDPHDVWTELASMPDCDVRALAVTLAACCDPTKSIHQMLAWTDELTREETAA